MKIFSFHFFNNLPAHQKKITLSTLLTLARIVVTPFIVASMVAGYWGVAFVLFIVASITDVLDGFLARMRNECTFLGAALDPVADKILLISCFFTLAFIKTPLFAVPFWFVLLVLIKELIVIGGAVLVYCLQGKLVIAPTFLGKATTVVQVCFIVWLFACYFFDWEPTKTYYILLDLLVVFVVASFIQYLYIGFCQYKARNTHKN